MAQSASSKNDVPLESSIPESGASLQSVLCTEELKRRPSRPPDYVSNSASLSWGFKAILSARNKQKLGVSSVLQLNLQSLRNAQERASAAVADAISRGHTTVTARFERSDHTCAEVSSVPLR